MAQADMDLRNPVFEVVQDLGALFETSDALIAIDIPIGLPKPHPRVCDLEARRLLGQPRGSSVFPAPARVTLTAKPHEKAIAVNSKELGVGISKQAFSIMPKILEVDRIMIRARQRYVREVHPEVSFACLNGGNAMQENKRTPGGRVERINVLRKSGMEISDASLRGQRQMLGPATLVANDDLVDALVCLVTALHVHRGRAHPLGDPNQRDNHGLLMEIVAPN